MPTTKRRGPRAADDARMNLYFDYGPEPERRLRWYVKTSAKGRRVGISEAYGSAEFDAAYQAAVAALGGELRMRRIEPESFGQQPARRYLHADVSGRGQLRYYVQLRDKLPKIRIRGEYDLADFKRAVDDAIVEQIAKFGDATDWVNAQKQRRQTRAALPSTPPKIGSLRFYWMLYRQSDRWLGCDAVGETGLAESTREARVGLIEPLLFDNGERPFKALTRKIIKAEMKARTPTQAGNLLSALRGMIGWMIEEEHLDEDDDPTSGIRSGKSKASRDSGGWVPWTEEDMTAYRKKWPLGTEARLMFDILHFTFLRVGDAARFGKDHLKKLLIQIVTEKSQGRTTVTIPVHPEFAVSLRAARAAGILGEGCVFTGKLVGGEVVAITKKAWGARFKKYARLAGVNMPKKNCHGVRKARAEAAAYADCTESQMMRMFGWTDPKMPAHYIAQAQGMRLAASGMDKLIAYDQSQNADVFEGPRDENRVVTLSSTRRKKA